VGEIIARFEKRGYKLVGLKAIVPSKDHTQKHYSDLRTKPFFNGLVDYMSSGKAPVIAMVSYDALPANITRIKPRLKCRFLKERM
jgi:nucleoside-diphosphate kinase